MIGTSGCCCSKPQRVERFPKKLQVTDKNDAPGLLVQSLEVASQMLIGVVVLPLREQFRMARFEPAIEKQDSGFGELPGLVCLK